MAYYAFSPETGARYSLTSPDGVTAVFNDATDPNYVGVLTEVTGLDSAEVRESADDLVEADGGQHGYFWLGRRPIVLNGKVYDHANLASRAARLDLGRRASMALRGDSTLSWKPSWRQENLITNPNAEAGVLTGWTAQAAAVPLSVSSAWANTGTKSFETVGTTAAGTTFPGIGHTSAARLPVIPGQRYAARAVVNQVTMPTGSNGCVLLMRFYDSTGTWLGNATDIFAGTNNLAAGVYSLAAQGLAPATAALIQISVYSTSTASSAVDFYVDNFMFSPVPMTTTNATIPGYFDGSTPGYYWQGTDNITASGNFIEMYTTVRRQQPWRESGGWVKDFQCALVSQFAPLFSVQQKTASNAAFNSNTAVENRGNFPAYPIIRLTGGGLSNPSVFRVGGELFTTTGLTIASGESLDIDMLNHTATFTAGARNGQSGNRYINWATTNWVSIPQGNYNIQFSGTGTGTMLVLYRDTWA